MSSAQPPNPDRDGSGWNSQPWQGRPVARGGPAPLGDPLVPPDLRGWFDRIVGIIRRSWMPLLLIQLCVAVVDGLMSYALGPNLGLAPTSGLGLPGMPGGGQSPPIDPFDNVTALLGLAVVFCASVFAQCASVYVAIRDAAGLPVSAEHAVRFAARRMPALLGWELVAGMLMAFGLLLLLVPGIYLGLVFGAALVGVVTVEHGPLGRCFELVNRRLWPTVGRMLLAAAVAVGYGFVADYLVSALSTPGSFNGAILQAVVAVPLSIAAVGVVVVTYAELRFHESDTVMTRTLADEIER